MSVKNKALEVRSISKRFGGVIALDIESAVCHGKSDYG